MRPRCPRKTENWALYNKIKSKITYKLERGSFRKAEVKPLLVVEYTLDEVVATKQGRNFEPHKPHKSRFVLACLFESGST